MASLICEHLDQDVKKTLANYSFGDVLLVPFPFTDQTTGKQRPAIVIIQPIKI